MSEHPSHYATWRFEEKNGDLKRFIQPWKEPKQGEVIAKVLACGVCGTDDHVRVQLTETGLPRTPGHEIVGDLVALGPGEQFLKVGDRVGSGWHGGHCGRCSQCGRGFFNLCEKQDVNGITREGGYAEYVTLRAEAVILLPKDMDPAEVAPLLCAGLTTFNGLRHTNASPGDLVAIQGIGGLGHLAIQYARAMGFRVVALSSSASKRDLAFELGAHEYIDGSKVDTIKALKDLGGARIIFATAPSNTAIAALLPALRIDGQLMLAGMAADKGEIPLTDLVVRRQSIVGWNTGTPADLDDTIKFSQLQGIKCMVERYPIEKAQTAFDQKPFARFRTVIVPGM